MKNTEEISDAAHQIASNVEAKLSESLISLQTSLARVERDLNLGCENLHDLVSSRNPHVKKQLDFLQGGLAGLHTSIADARASIADARGDALELKEVLPEPDGELDGGALGGSGEEFDQKRAAKMRHDEPITLGGVLRALLMADAPEQRM